MHRKSTQNHKPMKYLLIIACCCPLAGISQKITIKPISMMGNSRYIKSKKPTIVYPVIAASTPKMSKAFNDEISYAVFGRETPENKMNAKLKTAKKDGLTTVSYQTKYSKNDLYSLYVYQEICAAYCTSVDTYFNFDLRTGKNIRLTDLIAPNKLDSFNTTINRRISTAILNYKNGELKELTKKAMDTATYQWASDMIDNCTSSIAPEDFYLGKDSIMVIYNCDLPHAIRALAPPGIFSYSYKWLSYYLKPEYKDRLGSNK